LDDGVAAWRGRSSVRPTPISTEPTTLEKVMFTIEELNKLLQMLDLATKAGGLAVANEALPLAVKIQEVAKGLVDGKSTEE